MRPKAILIFADRFDVDLARRSLPTAACALLRVPRLEDGDAPAADVHLFSRDVPSNCARTANTHRQSGRDFRERLENAIETICALGYEEIVVVGRDCPNLYAGDIALAFEQLRCNRLVLGPDHRGGCYLIAFRSEDRELLRGVRWNRNTDRAELAARCFNSGVYLLAQKQDLDSWADLRLLALSGDWIGRIAAHLLASFSEFGDALGHFVDLAAQHVRVRGQMPPPALAG